MIGIAVRMLIDNKPRLVITVAGVAVLFFLSSAQVGLLVGWCSTTSALIRHANADVWVMPQQTPAFDYGTSLPEGRIQQVRSVPGVDWAEGMILCWSFWQRSDGRRVNVEIVGLDNDCVGGPWRLCEGRVEAVHLPETVIVDELFLAVLGVGGVGDEVELLGQRAVVGGVSQEVRTFTAAPFVFASLKSARKYDRRYDDDEVTYILARCSPGQSPAQVRDAILENVPYVDCLTSKEFAIRTMKYWMLETGAGITVVVTALLGFVVSAVVISQSLYAVTRDHLEHYAALLALGFGRQQLTLAVLVQSLTLGAIGTLLGSGLYFCAASLSSGTPIPLETTPEIFSGIVLASIVFCLLASFLAVRTLFRVDPCQVFRA
jgi:putative ABC transport system permease protein